MQPWGSSNLPCRLSYSSQHAGIEIELFSSQALLSFKPSEHADYVPGCGVSHDAALGHLDLALQTQLLRAGMSEPPQEASYRGQETVHPIWHDQELEALQHKLMTTLDIEAPKVILTTLPHGEPVASISV